MYVDGGWGGMLFFFVDHRGGVGSDRSLSLNQIKSIKACVFGVWRGNDAPTRSWWGTGKRALLIDQKNVKQKSARPRTTHTKRLGQRSIIDHHQRRRRTASPASDASPASADSPASDWARRRRAIGEMRTPARRRSASPASEDSPASPASPASEASPASDWERRRRWGAAEAAVARISSTARSRVRNCWCMWGERGGVGLGLCRSKSRCVRLSSGGGARGFGRVGGPRPGKPATARRAGRPLPRVRPRPPGPRAAFTRPTHPQQGLPLLPWCLVWRVSTANRRPRGTKKARSGNGLSAGRRCGQRTRAPHPPPPPARAAP